MILLMTRCSGVRKKICVNAMISFCVLDKICCLFKKKKKKLSWSINDAGGLIVQLPLLLSWFYFFLTGNELRNGSQGKVICNIGRQLVTFLS